MVDERELDNFRVDASIVVVLEVVCGVDSAGNGAVLEGCLHVILTSYAVVFSHVEFSCWGYRRAVIKSGLAFRRDERVVVSASSRMAVSANIDGFECRLEVVGHILFARAVHKSHIVRVFVHLGRLTSIAGSTNLSVDKHLSIDADWSLFARIIVDVKSVGNR